MARYIPRRYLVAQFWKRSVPGGIISVSWCSCAAAYRSSSEARGLSEQTVGLARPRRSEVKDWRMDANRLVRQKSFMGL